MNEDLLTKDELAVRLGISSSEVDNLRKKKGLPSIKLGRSYRYNLKIVKEFISKLGEQK